MYNCRSESDSQGHATLLASLVKKTSGPMLGYHPSVLQKMLLLRQTGPASVTLRTLLHTLQLQGSPTQVWNALLHSYFVLQCALTRYLSTGGHPMSGMTSKPLSILGCIALCSSLFYKTHPQNVEILGIVMETVNGQD